MEIQADILLKATRVNGVYDKDPEKFSNVKKYTNITFNEVMKKRIKVMDMTAFTLCYENDMNIIVFDMNKPNNLSNILLKGMEIGTLVAKSFN